LSTASEVKSFICKKRQSVYEIVNIGEDGIKLKDEDILYKH